MLYLLTLDEPVDQDDENSAAYRDNDACQVETANKISASEKAGDPAVKWARPCQAKYQSTRLFSPSSAMRR